MFTSIASKAGPEQARAMFASMLKRTNKLADQPEFYNAIFNNCTTNVVWHVNELQPNLVRYGSEVLLPGHSPRIAYDLDLIEKNRDFEQTQSMPARMKRFSNTATTQISRRKSAIILISI